jgi:hypothetical protein
MKPRFFSEIEAFPNKVLAARWPKVPNLGDMLKIDGTEHHGKVDVFWASFPCQDFSEAGKRKGVDGKHGILTIAGVIWSTRSIRPSSASRTCAASSPNGQPFWTVPGTSGRRTRPARLQGEVDARWLCAWTQAPHRVASPRRPTFRPAPTARPSLPCRMSCWSRFDPRAVLFERGASQDALANACAAGRTLSPGLGCAGRTRLRRSHPWRASSASRSSTRPRLQLPAREPGRFR